MACDKFKFIYGPVFSWRMGMSLGIDPLSQQEKVCNFDCSYCQLGSKKTVSSKRSFFVDIDAMIKEMRSLPKDVHIDYVTFSGNGEPTLALNIADMIKRVQQEFPQWKTALITNAATIMDQHVQQDILNVDFVLFKIDAATQKTFELINRPFKSILLKDIIEGIMSFKKSYRGKMALQMMFVESNKQEAFELAKIAVKIKPHEVQLNTPLRPCQQKPLSVKEMKDIKEIFVNQGLNVLSVYEEEKRKYQPFDVTATRRRHGYYDQ